MKQREAYPSILRCCVGVWRFWLIVVPCSLASLVFFGVIDARCLRKYNTSVIGRCLFCCKVCFPLCRLQHAISCHVSDEQETAFLRVYSLTKSVWNLSASRIPPLHNKRAHMLPLYLLLCHPNSDGSLFWWSVPVAPNGWRDRGRLWSSRETWTVSEWRRGGKTGQNGGENWCEWRARGEWWVEDMVELRSEQ